MSFFYLILCLIGWSWTLIVAIVLIIKRNSRKVQPRGVDFESKA